jgi:hypothetical protein
MVANRTRMTDEEVVMWLMLTCKMFGASTLTSLKVAEVVMARLKEERARSIAGFSAEWEHSG